MSKLRIAYLVPSLNPGGAEKQAVALAEHLPRERFSADFLVMSGPGAYDERATAAGLRVRNLGSLPGPSTGRLRQIGRRLWKTTRYATAARAGDYDVVDAWLHPLDVVAALLRGVTGTPVVVGGRRSLANAHSPFGALDRRVASFANGHLDAVVANSEAVAEQVRQLERLAPSKLRIIRNGVEVPALPSPQERAMMRQELGLRPDEIAVGCVANYRAVKGLDGLLEAFAEVVATVPTARLFVIGDGEERAKLEGLIRSLGLEDRARLVGTMIDPRPCLAAFDVVVQSSRREGMPNALLEAAAAGRPIVATDAGGTREIIDDGVTGLLVPTQDRNELVKGIVRLASDAALAARLGAAARVRVEDRFRLDRFVAEFADLYESLVAASRARRRAGRSRRS